MKILCISKYAAPPKYSKMPARLFYLAKHFLQLGHDVSLITSDANHLANYPSTPDVYNYEQVESVPVCWIKTKKYIRTSSIKRVLSWLDFELKLFRMDIEKVGIPDVVIVSSLSLLTILYGAYLKKKFGSFLVFEIRDIWPLTMVEEGGFSKWHPLVLFLGLVEKFGYKKANLVVGTMPRLDLHVKNILGYDKPFFCSPLGFNNENYSQELHQRKSPYYKEFPKNKFVVGYAGSMGVTNALEPFIKAIAEMKDDAGIHFVLLGSGDLRSDYESYLAHCDNVTFFPRIEQSEVKYFLEKCDLLYLSTHPSKIWGYGQSMNKIVEYMLAAKPIIASYNGYPSMLNEAGCGYFVSTRPDDIKKAIYQVASMSEDERLKLGEKGRAWMFENRQYRYLAKAYVDPILKILRDMN